MLIVIEGQDATGKDVQAQKLKEYLEQKGQKVTLYAESGTGSKDPFVQAISNLTYKTDQNISHEIRSLLYLINRYHQWEKIGLPALENNQVVITTRSWISTLLYEGYAGGTDIKVIEKIHQLYLPERYFNPDKIVILTLDDQERERRISTQQTRKNEIFKTANNKYQPIINKGYLRVAKQYNIPTLDTAKSPDEVFKDLLKLFDL